MPIYELVFILFFVVVIKTHISLSKTHETDINVNHQFKLLNEKRLVMTALANWKQINMLNDDNNNACVCLLE